MDEKVTIYPCLDGEIGLSLWKELIRFRTTDADNVSSTIWLDKTCTEWLISALQDALKDM